jgi:hypothetical protein
VKVRVTNLAIVGAIPVVLRLEVDDLHFATRLPSYLESHTGRSLRVVPARVDTSRHRS